MNIKEEVEDEEDSASSLLPYCDTLEYLDEKFKLLAVMVQAEETRTKAQVKQAGGQQRGYNVNNDDKAVSQRELDGKIKYLNGRIARRLELTVAEGPDRIPKLEQVKPLHGPTHPDPNP